MLYIAFSSRSHKLYAQILCRKYRHCAPVLMTDNKCIIYQFIKRGQIAQISIRPDDINILKHYGWKFVKYDTKFAPTIALKTKPWTCVQFTKQSIGIRKITIQTPDALLRYLNRKK